MQKQNKQAGFSSSQPTKCQNFWCCLIDGQKGVVGLVMLAVWGLVICQKNIMIKNYILYSFFFIFEKQAPLNHITGTAKEKTINK